MLARWRVAKLARIAAENTRFTAEPERFDIGAEQRARIGCIIDEECPPCTARQASKPIAPVPAKRSMIAASATGSS